MSETGTGQDAVVRVAVYGTGWCAATQMARRTLERLGIVYEYLDMDTDSGAERQVRWWTGGDASHPTLQVGRDILIEPTASELMSALAKNGLG
ncbi:MAG TPA: glutaredoxin domain-containing protein [Anaerolineaceae bacterium]